MPTAITIRNDISSAELRHAARREADRRVVCWLLAIANALDGMSREQAGMDCQALRDWVILYNTDGIDGLHDHLQSGRSSFLDEGQMAVFRAMVLRGPDIERDAVSSWTAKDLCLLVARRFGARYQENGMLKLLHSLGLSWQKTRPSHPRADLKAQAAFKKLKKLIEDIATFQPHGSRIEIWFQDETRIGQTC